MNRFKVKVRGRVIPPHIHILILWIAIGLTLLVTLVGFFRVIGLANISRSVLYQACLDTNQRHKATFRYLDKLENKQLKLAPTPAAAAVIRHNFHLFDVLTSRELPLRNCTHFINGGSSLELHHH